MKLKIINSKIDELNFINNLLKETLRELKLPLNSFFYYKNSIEKLVKNNQMVLSAYVNDDFAGFIAASRPEGGVGTILWLIVKPEYRNREIGTILFNEISKRLKSIGCHKLKLTTPNNKSIRFYKKLGMSIEGFHPSHWWGMDFWSLGKLL